MNPDTAVGPPERARHRTPYVYVQAPRCPWCGSPKLLAYKSVANGDGTRTRYTRCSTCGEKVILVVE